MQLYSLKKKRRTLANWIFAAVLIIAAALCYVLYENVEEPLTAPPPSKSVNPPSFSHRPGFYDEPFMLSLSAGEKGIIFYSINGNAPGPEARLFSEPILVRDRSRDPNSYSVIPTSPRWKLPSGYMPKATVVRSMIFTDGGKASKPATNTYFIGQRYSLPVISLVTDSINLFGYRQGIYVMGKGYEDKDNYVRKNVRLDAPWWQYPANYLSRGKNSERPVTLQLFGFSSEPITVDAGVRISGNATRAFSQKSLQVSFRDIYDTPEFKHRLFADSLATTNYSFVLRNGGNDWNKAMLRDAFMQSLLRGKTSLDLQHSRAVILFMNGEYWGIHHLTERMDEHYLAGHYKISPDSVSIIENSGAVYRGTTAESDRFKALVKFAAANDLSVAENYRRMERELDIENFIDYVIAQVYFANTDWPNNNVKAWRYIAEPSDTAKNSRDGRWRWMVSDLDFGFGYSSSSLWSMDMFAKLSTHKSAVAKLYRGLSANPGFRKRFRERFLYHLDNTFEVKTVTGRLDEMVGILAPEMGMHIRRWRVPDSYEDWEEHLSDMRDFARKRGEEVKLQLNKLPQ